MVHVDGALIVVDKPAGLLAVPGRGAAGRFSLAASVQAEFADALVVHRLDMATSGLMLFARGAATQRALSIAFAARQVAKQYTAVVDGMPAADNGSIALPLSPDWPNRPRQVVDLQHGKPSLTHWQVLSRDTVAGRARLLLQPVSGRSHQLRVHLASSGHAIVGDTLYAPPAVAAGAPRLLLHANHIALTHPLTGAPLSFDSAVPF